MWFLAFLIFFLTPVVSRADTGNPPSDTPVLVLYAFSEEGAQLREEMCIEETDTVLGRAIYRGDLSGEPIVLAESGVGLINAAMTSQALIDLYRPRAVVFTGIAGAIDTSVHIGDIVICSRWRTHDYGYYGADGLEPSPVRLYVPGEDSVRQVFEFVVDSSFLEAAHTLLETELNLELISGRVPRLLIGGCGVSGNSFIDSADKRRWLSKTFDALITDMESAAVGHVCTANGLPFVIFRSASDLAGGSGSESARAEMSRFLEIAATNSARMLLAFLERL